METYPSWDINEQKTHKPKFTSQWLIGGLGPGGLDIWDPFMKGILT